MVQTEILLCVALAAVGFYLLIGVLRGSGRRTAHRPGHQGPGGVRAELTTPVGGAPDSEAAPATLLDAAQPVAPGLVIGAAPAAPALPIPALPAPDLPVRRSRAAAARTVRGGVHNSRFARFDHSGRPASMASPYLRTERPAPR
jgi:hypothetical protein